MIRSIFTSAARLSLMPSILLASAAGAVASTVAFTALGADAGFWNLRPPAMTGLVLGLALRYWLWTCIATTALAMRRANLRWRPFTFVPLPVAFEAGVMSLARRTSDLGQSGIPPNVAPRTSDPGQSGIARNVAPRTPDLGQPGIANHWR